MFLFRNKDTAMHAGFTLIEVLVAISVISIIGFLPISIVSEHLIRNALTKNRVTAALLAQEITEYVRYTRDSDILDIGGGDWFDTLFDPRSTNQFAPCTIDADDWILEDRVTYCTVECFDNADKTARGECGTKGSGNKIYNGSVAGISATRGVRGRSTETCDGNRPKENNAFTTTLNIVIPQQGSKTRYAVMAPCISWSDKTDTVRRVELQEAVFEWIRRTK
ncbi:MAG: prepilin-type N-terminal cleavage/methylation domain-containing protein [Candidatus Kaiserbacteria bacterium]|nr:prepilin-type N-terminal cleavage/methylation domain-containing protein [Candidatus Kaiserbacteria bacterium]